MTGRLLEPAAAKVVDGRSVVVGIDGPVDEAHAKGRPVAGKVHVGTERRQVAAGSHLLERGAVLREKIDVVAIVATDIPVDKIAVERSVIVLRGRCDMLVARNDKQGKCSAIVVAVVS